MSKIAQCRNNRRIIILTFPSGWRRLVNDCLDHPPSWRRVAMPLILEVLSRSDVETVLAGGGTAALRRAVADFLRRTHEERRPPTEVAAAPPSNKDPVR